MDNTFGDSTRGYLAYSARVYRRDNGFSCKDYDQVVGYSPKFTIFEDGSALTAQKHLSNEQREIRRSSKNIYSLFGKQTATQNPRKICHFRGNL